MCNNKPEENKHVPEQFWWCVLRFGGGMKSFHNVTSWWDEFNVMCDCSFAMALISIMDYDAARGMWNVKRLISEPGWWIEDRSVYRRRHSCPCTIEQEDGRSYARDILCFVIVEWQEVEIFASD